jgi:O-antigen/teichoic acid export membrane protein
MLARLLALMRLPLLARFNSLADQGLQGVANIVAIAALGRALAPDQFGAVGIAVGIYYFVAGFHRSIVVLPYITEHEHLGTAAEDRRYHSNWWWISVAVSLVLAAMLGAMALALLLASTWQPAWHWGVSPLALGALLTPPLLWAEHIRRWLYKIGRSDVVALISALYALVLVGGAILLPHLRADALGGTLAFVAAGLAATVLPLLALLPCAPDVPASFACLARHRQFATWLALTILPYVFYSSATVVVLIGLFDGAYAAAVFTAARTLTNPAVSIVSAVDSIDKPRAARALAEHGIAGLRESVRKTRLLLIAVTGGYLAAVALFAEPLLHLLFQSRYPGITQEVRVLALAIFLFCLNQPSETLLIVLRASKVMFVARSLTAMVTVAALYAGSGSGVTGMALGLAAAQAANLGFLWIAERWTERQRQLREALA